MEHTCFAKRRGCGEVMADLAEFLDGDLPADRLRRLQGLLADCESCELAGGGTCRALVAFEQSLAVDDPRSEITAELLRRRLLRDLGERRGAALAAEGPNFV